MKRILPTMKKLFNWYRSKCIREIQRDYGCTEWTAEQSFNLAVKQFKMITKWVSIIAICFFLFIYLFL